MVEWPNSVTFILFYYLYRFYKCTHYGYPIRLVLQHIRMGFLETNILQIATTEATTERLYNEPRRHNDSRHKAISSRQSAPIIFWILKLLKFQ